MERSEKKARGELYDRVKLAKVKPPQFAEQKKKQLLLYVDVNVTPTKTGRIGIHEGDDVRELARNFCKTFGLHKTMYDALLKHLQQSVAKYYEGQQKKKEKAAAAHRLPNLSQLGYSVSKTGLQSAQQLPAGPAPEDQKAGETNQQNDEGAIVSALSASPMAQSAISGRVSDAPHNNFMMTQEMLEEVKKYGEV